MSRLTDRLVILTDDAVRLATRLILVHASHNVPNSVPYVTCGVDASGVLSILNDQVYARFAKTLLDKHPALSPMESIEKLSNFSQIQITVATILSKTQNLCSLLEDFAQFHNAASTLFEDCASNLRTAVAHPFFAHTMLKYVAETYVVYHVASLCAEQMAQAFVLRRLALVINSGSASASGDSNDVCQRVLEFVMRGQTGWFEIWSSLSKLVCDALDRLSVPITGMLANAMSSSNQGFPTGQANVLHPSMNASWIWPWDSKGFSAAAAVPSLPPSSHVVSGSFGAPVTPNSVSPPGSAVTQTAPLMNDKGLYNNVSAAWFVPPSECVRLAVLVLIAFPEILVRDTSTVYAGAPLARLLISEVGAFPLSIVDPAIVPVLVSMRIQIPGILVPQAFEALWTAEKKKLKAITDVAYGIGSAGSCYSSDAVNKCLQVHRRRKMMLRQVITRWVYAAKADPEILKIGWRGLVVLLSLAYYEDGFFTGGDVSDGVPLVAGSQSGSSVMDTSSVTVGSIEQTAFEMLRTFAVNYAKMHNQNDNSVVADSWDPSLLASAAEAVSAAAQAPGTTIRQDSQLVDALTSLSLELKQAARLNAPTATPFGPGSFCEMRETLILSLLRLIAKVSSNSSLMKTATQLEALPAIHAMCVGLGVGSFPLYPARAIATFLGTRSCILPVPIHAASHFSSSASLDPLALNSATPVPQAFLSHASNALTTSAPYSGISSSSFLLLYPAVPTCAAWIPNAMASLHPSLSVGEKTSASLDAVHEALTTHAKSLADRLLHCIDNLIHAARVDPVVELFLLKKNSMQKQNPKVLAALLKKSKITLEQAARYMPDADLRALYPKDIQKREKKAKGVSFNNVAPSSSSSSSTALSSSSSISNSISSSMSSSGNVGVEGQIDYRAYFRSATFRSLTFMHRQLLADWTDMACASAIEINHLILRPREYLLHEWSQAVVRWIENVAGPLPSSLSVKTFKMFLSVHAFLVQSIPLPLSLNDVFPLTPPALFSLPNNRTILPLLRLREVWTFKHVESFCHKVWFSAKAASGVYSSVVRGWVAFAASQNTAVNSSAISVLLTERDLLRVCTLGRVAPERLVQRVLDPAQNEKLREAVKTLESTVGEVAQVQVTLGKKKPSKPVIESFLSSLIILGNIAICHTLLMTDSAVPVAPIPLPALSLSLANPQDLFRAVAAIPILMYSRLFPEALLATLVAEDRYFPELLVHSTRIHELVAATSWLALGSEPMFWTTLRETVCSWKSEFKESEMDDPDFALGVVFVAELQNVIPLNTSSPVVNKRSSLVSPNRVAVAEKAVLLERSLVLNMKCVLEKGAEKSRGKRGDTRLVVEEAVGKEAGGNEVDEDDAAPADDADEDQQEVGVVAE
eukprot:ANDGO_05157.mRNA.1 hypothetical protein